MKQPLTLLIAQINPKVGDISQNTKQIIEVIQGAQASHDVIIFPELALTGYPPEDLLLHPELYVEVNQALLQIQAATHQCHVVLGHPYAHNHQAFNRASVFQQQQCIYTYDKHHLPNDSVFDEKRYFTPGPLTAMTFKVKDHTLGVCICEDLWQPGPVEQHLQQDTELLILINASPFDVQKPTAREALLTHYAKQGLAIVYANLVGGQDELVFDGQSLVFDAQGKLCARLPAFETALQTVHYLSNQQIESTLSPAMTPENLLYQALCCGLRDYVHKNGFQDVLIGASGGVDSALTLAIATDALGHDHVHAVLMPSRYTAAMSNEDALAEIQALGITHDILPIEPAFEALLSSLQAPFKNKPVDLTEENMQARIRGLFLMALSNKTGKLVLTTSNKSETAVGYATLYGDMCGGFGVLKDVFKTEVYRLARYRNQISPVIPQRVLDRPPSAELRLNQTDQDNLPDYDTLDKILVYYMEQKYSATEIIALGFDQALVHRVLNMLSKNEYKRQQAPPGVKVSARAFGKDWRYPITSGFKSR